MTQLASLVIRPSKGIVDIKKPFVSLPCACQQAQKKRPKSLLIQPLVE